MLACKRKQTLPPHHRALAARPEEKDESERPEVQHALESCM